MNSVKNIDDTIAAISTPFGAGGIGIIRISGEKTFEIVKKIFKPAKEKEIKTYTLRYGHIIDPLKNEIIDEVLISYFIKPNTFTRENMAEINCHGGINVVRNALDIILENGARLAEPGEFTMRAFLNGRIDLSQAEAIINIINSKTNFARKTSLNQLEGKLSQKIKELRNSLIDTISDIEAAIDYPEYDIEEISRAKIKDNLNNCQKTIKKLVKSFFDGKILMEGVETAIVGKPNVGKSSLLNALVQKDRAIITDIPGTTRDVIEEYIDISGIPIKILDTAGIRETEDKIEKVGIEKSKRAIKRADLILVVLDGSKKLDEEDFKVFESIKNKKSIIIINKSDLEIKISPDDINSVCSGKEIIEISAKSEEGIEKVENAIKSVICENEIDIDNELIVTDIRHKKIIEETSKLLEEGIKLTESQTPVDIVSVIITEAANKLGEITGETVGEDVLKSIFSKFCIGK